MNNYEFESTRLIANAFERRGINFQVTSRYGTEFILAEFPIDSGPNAIMRFINCGEKDITAVRVSLLSNIPKEKIARITEACNIINYKYTLVKVYIDPDGNTTLAYDFLTKLPDESLGERAVEIFICAKRILDLKYSVLMKALYTEEKLDPWGDDIIGIMKALKGINQAAGNSGEDDFDVDDFDDDRFDEDDDYEDEFDEDKVKELIAKIDVEIARVEAEEAQMKADLVQTETAEETEENDSDDTNDTTNI